MVEVKEKSAFETAVSEGGDANLASEATSVAAVIEKKRTSSSIEREELSLEAYREMLNNKILTFNAVYEVRKEYGGGEEATAEGSLPFDEQIIAKLRKMEE